MPKKTFKAVVNSGNDCIIPVEKNQPNLYEEVKTITETSKPIDKFKTGRKKSHGRLELRKAEVYECPSKIYKEGEIMFYVKRIVKVIREREVITGPKVESENTITETYYLSTIKLSAKDFNKVIQNHWHIENTNNHVLDVTFREDELRLRNSPKVFTRLTNFAINLLRENKDKNMPEKRFRHAFGLRRLLQLFEYC